MDLILSRSEREMLKAVYRLSKGGYDAHTGALAEHLGITPGTVTTTLKRLAERELADHRPYRGVELTHLGRQAAVAAIRRHRIVERFLADLLGYTWQEADRLAGAFEHDLPEEVEQRIFEKLGNPTTCPHGFPIPDPEVDRIPQMPALVDLATGDEGVVALSSSIDDEIISFLDSQGIRPGAHIEVVDRHPFAGPVVVRVEGEERTVGERLAERIFVKSLRLVAADLPARPEREPVDALNVQHQHQHSAPQQPSHQQPQQQQPPQQPVKPQLPVRPKKKPAMTKKKSPAPSGQRTRKEHSA